MPDALRDLTVVPPGSARVATGNGAGPSADGDRPAVATNRSSSDQLMGHHGSGNAPCRRGRRPAMVRPIPISGSQPAARCPNWCPVLSLLAAGTVTNDHCSRSDRWCPATHHPVKPSRLISPLATLSTASSATSMLAVRSTPLSTSVTSSAAWPMRLFPSTNGWF